MKKINKSIQSYIFWLALSIITGGIIIIVPILAPIAFTTMPVTVFLKSLYTLIPMQELYLPYSLSNIFQ